MYLMLILQLYYRLIFSVFLDSDNLPIMCKTAVFMVHYLFHLKTMTNTIISTSQVWEFIFCLPHLLIIIWQLHIYLYLKLPSRISWYFLLGVVSHTITVGFISIDIDICVTVLCEFSDKIWHDNDPKWCRIIGLICIWMSYMTLLRNRFVTLSITLKVSKI